MPANLHFNSHVRTYRKHHKKPAHDSHVQKYLYENQELTTIDHDKPQRTVAEILEHVAQTMATALGYSSREIMVICDIEDIGTIRHRGKAYIPRA